MEGGGGVRLAIRGGGEVEGGGVRGGVRLAIRGGGEVEGGGVRGGVCGMNQY